MLDHSFEAGWNPVIRELRISNSECIRSSDGVSDVAISERVEHPQTLGCRFLGQRMDSVHRVSGPAYYYLVVDFYSREEMKTSAKGQHEATHLVLQEEVKVGCVL